MELTANAIQTIKTGDNVLFTEVRTPGSCSILHQNGSGLVILRGICNGQCRARFRVHFTGNLSADVSVSTPLYLAISQNGETIPVSTMITTVGTNVAIQNVSTDVLIDVPAGCCQTIAIKNITTALPISVQNANLIVERVA